MFNVRKKNVLKYDTILFVETDLFVKLDLEMKQINLKKVLMQKEHTEYANVCEVMGSVDSFLKTEMLGRWSYFYQ